MLRTLSLEERELVITLAEEFLRCRWNDYPALLDSALASLDPALLQQVDEVVILPLAETRKNGKPKSSSALLYPAKYVVVPNLPGINGKRIEAYERMSLLKEQCPNRGPTLVLFLDDFIGSGGTAVTTIARFKQEVEKPTDRVFVAALVAQQQGLSALDVLGVDVGVAIKRQKGITESTRIQDGMRALELMDAIETRLDIGPDYRRGYRESEALVTMIRTPNNTFPVFWTSRSSDGSEWPAPFRR